VKGEGVVTAADIIAPAEVEIVNPELYLFTVDDDKAHLEIEMNVERGRGYSPSDERGRLPIGELPTDAIFNPVRRVHYEIGRARVGQDTSYDSLVMEIWTDGTIKPEEALSRSAQILMAHLRDIGGVTEESLMVAAVEEEDTRLTSEVYEIPIENLDLTVRVFNSLKRTGITNVGEKRCYPSATSARRASTNSRSACLRRAILTKSRSRRKRRSEGLMRHQVAGKRLSRSKGHRIALRKNLMKDLFRHERIKTTKAKAAAVRGGAEKLITLAKKRRRGKADHAGEEGQRSGRSESSSRTSPGSRTVE
jgi:DNA-directed RNA polymerase alpha subunit